MALIDFNPHISNDNFYYVEGSTNVANFIKTIAEELTDNAGVDYNWTLVEPTTLEEITNKVIISCTTSFAETFYLSIFRDDEDTPITYVNMVIGTELDELTESGIKDGKVSPTTRFAWYLDSIDVSIQDWLPINYWMNVNKDSFNLIVRGDPSADTYPYSKFLMSYCYVGTLLPIEEGQSLDTLYNFGITVGSNIAPTLTTLYGPRTATGITDVCMIANKIGMPFQPHYPAFYTANITMDKMNIEGSRWNNQKHQFSDITLVHPIDMERGKMQNILVGDPAALSDNDKLVFKQGTTEQEMFRKFTITAPYTFLNNGPNVLYAVAIRCYNDDEVYQVDDGLGE